MYHSKKELANYRMDRAWEAIDEAKLLITKKHWNTSANRLYYASFYSVSAYLIIKDFTASTHNGVKTAFNKNLVNTGLLPRSYGLLYNKLFNLRQDTDYRDFRDTTEDIIIPMIEDIENLLIKIQSLIEETS